jgi:hypothetical protein
MDKNTGSFTSSLAEECVRMKEFTILGERVKGKEENSATR